METKQVSPEFRTRLVAGRAELEAVKAELGAHEVEYETRKARLFEKLRAADAALIGVARDAGVALGLDPTSADWLFDWGQLAFVSAKPAAPPLSSGPADGFARAAKALGLRSESEKRASPRYAGLVKKGKRR